MYGPEITNTGLWAVGILIGIAGYIILRTLEFLLGFVSITIT